MDQKKQARVIVDRLLATVEKYGTMTGRRGEKSLTFPLVFKRETGEGGTQIVDVMAEFVDAALREEREQAAKWEVRADAAERDRLMALENASLLAYRLRETASDYEAAASRLEALRTEAQTILQEAESESARIVARRMLAVLGE